MCKYISELLIYIVEQCMLYVKGCSFQSVLEKGIFLNGNILNAPPLGHENNYIYAHSPNRGSLPITSSVQLFPTPSSGRASDRKQASVWRVIYVMVMT